MARRIASGFPLMTVSTACCNRSICSAALALVNSPDSTVSRFLIKLAAFYMLRARVARKSWLYASNPRSSHDVTCGRSCSRLSPFEKRADGAKSGTCELTLRVSCPRRLYGTPEEESEKPARLFADRVDDRDRHHRHSHRRRRHWIQGC